MRKREFRRRLQASVMQRAENQRYDKANRLDELYEVAAKKKKRRDRGRRAFFTMFPIPVAAAARRQGEATHTAINAANASSGLNALRSTSTTADDNDDNADDNVFVPAVLLHERVEILLLAVCVTYSIVLETGEDLGYWGKKVSFAIAVAVLFVVHRLDSGSPAYYLKPAPWHGAFRFALSFGWALFLFGVAKTSSQYNFVFRTGVAVVAFAARQEALPRLVGAVRRWRRARYKQRGVKEQRGVSGQTFSSYVQ